MSLASKRALYSKTSVIILMLFGWAAMALTGCGSMSSGLPPTSADPLQAEQDAARANPDEEDSRTLLKPNEHDAFLQDIFEVERTQTDEELAAEAQKRSDADDKSQASGKTKLNDPGVFDEPAQAGLKTTPDSELNSSEFTKPIPKRKPVPPPQNVGSPDVNEKGLSSPTSPKPVSHEPKAPPSAITAPVYSGGHPIYDNKLCDQINVATRELEVDLAGAYSESGKMPATLPVAYYRNIESTVKSKGLKFNASQLKKNHFICVLLPIAIRMNAQVYRQRLEVLRIDAKQKSGQTLTEKESAWLRQIKSDYSLKSGSSNQDLLKRVDIVPIGLLMAQAAEESGWGTSRAAEVANNIFGLHGQRPGPNCVRATGNPSVCLRKFNSISEGVAGYIRYMNTENGGKYKFLVKFREMRATMRSNGQTLDSVKLAGTLIGYSERGSAYVAQIRNIMSEWNNLTKYQFREEKVAALQKGRPVQVV